MVAIVLFGNLQLLWAVDDAGIISFVCGLFHICCLGLLFFVQPPGIPVLGTTNEGANEVLCKKIDC